MTYILLFVFYSSVCACTYITRNYDEWLVIHGEGEMVMQPRWGAPEPSGQECAALPQSKQQPPEELHLAAQGKPPWDSGPSGSQCLAIRCRKTLAVGVTWAPRGQRKWSEGSVGFHTGVYAEVFRTFNVLHYAPHLPLAHSDNGIVLLTWVSK